MGASNYKIGQVASQVGISVRTLRHYDEIGLLKPTARAATGHRLYSDGDIARLKKIVALRKMGFSINHIRTVLSGDTAEAFKTLEGEAARLRTEISQQQEVLKGVEAVLDFKSMHTSFTTADTERLKKQSADILAALRQEMERGTDPKDPRVQQLIADMTKNGQELMDYVGGREKTLERMENYKRYQSLIPQASQDRLDEMRAKMKPFQEKMRDLFEYIKRAKP